MLARLDHVLNVYHVIIHVKNAQMILLQAAALVMTMLNYRMIIAVFVMKDSL